MEGVGDFARLNHCHASVSLVKDMDWHTWDVRDVRD